MRSRSSPAALRLKVRTRIRSGAMPRFSIRSATAATIVVVLPVPGPASTSSGPPLWSTTCCCAWSRRGGPLAAPAPAPARGRRTRRYAGARDWSITGIPADGTDISGVIRGGSACRGDVFSGCYAEVRLGFCLGRLRRYGGRVRADVMRALRRWWGGAAGPAGAAQVDADRGAGGAERGAFGQVVPEGHAVVPGGGGAVGVDHPPPRHRAAVDGHHAADLAGPGPGAQVLGDVAVGHHPAGRDRVHHVEHAAGEFVNRRRAA